MSTAITQKMDLFGLALRCPSVAKAKTIQQQAFFLVSLEGCLNKNWGMANFVEAQG
jgi:hypothetical protein